ncbi:MAG: sigma-70 family RNA polymerase sigma factor [Bryobacterales bacterium]|nr:sigma-70 family RNA polymerase sigma factor [Bryobacterales bacterium]
MGVPEREREVNQPPFALTREQFQDLYGETARPLKSYLLRLTQNAAVADEVLQEAYYRFLRAELPELGPRERKNYLFRIATNLVRDLYRGKLETSLPLSEAARTSTSPHLDHTPLKEDLGRVLDTLKPRERELVWLAYVEGSSHREIAQIMGLREVSIRPMLFRVRQKLADLLRSIGYCERMVL